MLRLWRLYRAVHGPGLDGIGGTMAGGRWHSLGQRAVYFGATPAIVVLEKLAHVDPDLLPEDLRLGCFEFKEPVSPTSIDEKSLPQGWTERETITQKFGTDWLRAGSACLLKVPSVLLPEESNYLFNPQQEQARHLHAVSERAFSFDARLL